jgi:hypothetical protein
MTGNYQKSDMVKYVDFNGLPLPDHDGTMIEIPEHGFQYFDHNGKGFIHDGSPIKLPNGKHLFFLHDGKAVINDGSPIELENGMMQYFDCYGQAMWPVDEKKFAPLYTRQRELFFEERIESVTKNTPLEKSEIEELRLALMACEHPDHLAKENVFDFPPEAKQIKATAISDETEGYLLILKGFWCSVWRDYQLRHKETLSARFILRQNIENNCLLAGYHLSESMLAGELKREFKKAEIEIPVPQQYKEFIDIGVTKSGVYALDDLLIKYFSRFGWSDAAEELVEQLKSMYKSKTVDISDRIASWRHPLFLHRCVANIVWFDVIRPKIKSHYNKAAALPLLVSNNLQNIMKKGTVYDQVTGKITDKQGCELALIEKDKLIQIPSIAMSTMQKILSPENVKVLSSVNAHRLLRWEIQTVTKQVIEDKIDARHIHIPGGYQELARIIGAGTSGKAQKQVRDLLIWQAAPKQFSFTDPETGKIEIIKEANMLSFQNTIGGRGAKNYLEIVVGTMLVPHYLYKLIKTSSIMLSDEALKLVPIVDMPQMVGRPNEQGAQLILQMEIVVEFRKGAKELAKNGCIQITKERFKYLASKSGVSQHNLPAVLAAWLQGGKDAPAFLEQIEEDHYAFSPNCKQVQDFIIQGGKKEITMSKAARTAIERKNKGILSSTKKKN